MYRRMLTIHRTLKIYGPSDKRDQLEPQLIWATPRQRGFPPRGVGGATKQVSSTAYAVAAGPPAASSSSTSQPSSSQRYGAKATQSKSQQEAIKKQQEAVRKHQEALQNAAELKQMLGGLEKVDDEGRRASLLDALCSVDDILNLPVHPAPPGIANGDLVVDLLRHQVGGSRLCVFHLLDSRMQNQALQWCIDHEYPSLPTKESDKPVQFWQYRKIGSEVS